MNLTDCVPENTRRFRDGCICLNGFYGEICDQRYEWYPYTLAPFYILEGLVLIAGMAWTGIYFYRKRDKEMNLAKTAVLLNLAAMVLRLIELALPMRERYLTEETENLSRASSIMRFLVSICWIMTDVLIVGFWVVAFRSKLANNQQRMKLATIIIGVLLLVVALFGIGLSFSSELRDVGSFVAVSPVFALVVFLITLTMILIRTNSSDFSDRNKEKKRWVQIIFILMTCNWVLYTLLTVINFIVNAPGGNPGVAGIEIMFRFCEIGMVILNLMLFDYRGSVLQVVSISSSSS